MNKKVIVSILQYIEDNIESVVLIDDIIVYSGFSRRGVYDLFIKYAKISPGKYIRQRRLCRAANWLRLTSMPCIDMAHALGFSSQQSFSREFRRYFGMPPREYRDAKVWDMSLLRLPIDIDNVKTDFPEMYAILDIPRMVVFGREIVFKEPLPYTAVNRIEQKFQKIIDGHFKKNNSEVYIASELLRKREGHHHFYYTTFIGTVDSNDSNDSNDSKKIFGGKFLKYEFTGTSEEYISLPVKLSLEVLPQLNLKRRTGMDVEHFKSYNSELLSCSYFIPVSE